MKNSHAQHEQHAEFVCPVCGLVFTDPSCEDTDEPLYCSDACVAAAHSDGCVCGCSGPYLCACGGRCAGPECQCRGDHSDGSGSGEGVGVDRPVAPLSSYQAAPSSDDRSDGPACDHCHHEVDHYAWCPSAQIDGCESDA